MILVIGQFHSSLVGALERSGESYHILKDAKRYTTADAVDFSDETSLFERVHSLSPQPELAIAMYEQYIPICARINEQLGVSTALSSAAALNSTDKVLMRKAFAVVAGISPAYQEVESEAQALAFCEAYGFPVIIKPANLSKSMLVTKCLNEDDVRNALKQIESDAPKLYEKYTLGQTPRFIIEEFMEGSIHTVAAFADKDGAVSCAPGVVDNTSAIEAGFDDSFIYERLLPSRLDETVQRQLVECAIKGVKALGIRSSPAHVELIQTKDGPRIIEIGARLGGYRPRMYDTAYGIDLYDSALQSLRGSLPTFVTQSTRFIAVHELFPKRTGSFVAITPAPHIEAFEYLSIRPKVGAMVGPAKRGYKATAILVSSASSSSQLRDFIANSVAPLTVEVTS